MLPSTKVNLNASEELDMSRQDNGAGSNQGEVTTGNVQQFLTFMLNDEEYGIGILHIREIIEYDNLTVVPLMPDFISGVINLRGNVVPVVNLARRFQHEPKDIGKRTSIVIIDIKDHDGESVEIGIVVDIVNEVIELASSDIAAAPSFGAKIRADFIQGMGKIEDKLMILLDVDKVLSINELSAITGIADELNAPAVSNG
jgi:purine-binding chemotaxis protein CheW